MGILHAGIVNALDNCKIVSICENDTLVKRIGGNLLRNVRFYSKTERMLKDENLDAVFVTTPIATHLQMIEAVADAKSPKAIFVEKPLAATYKDALRSCELGQSAGLSTAVGFQMRYAPSFAKAKSLISGGVIGTPLAFTGYSYLAGVFSQGRGWRFSPAQGGALIDLGPHLIDLVCWYFGEPNVLSSRLTNVYSKAVEDEATATLNCNGIPGEINVNWSVPGYRLQEVKVTVTGEDGTLTVSDDFVSLEIHRAKSHFPRGHHYFSKPALYEGVDYLVGNPEYCTQDKAFLLGGDVPGSLPPNFTSAVVVNKVIDEIRKVAKEG